MTDHKLNVAIFSDKMNVQNYLKTDHSSVGVEFDELEFWVKGDVPEKLGGQMITVIATIKLEGRRFTTADVDDLDADNLLIISPEIFEFVDDDDDRPVNVRIKDALKEHISDRFTVRKRYER